MRTFSGLKRGDVIVTEERVWLVLANLGPYVEAFRLDAARGPILIYTAAALRACWFVLEAP